MSAKIKKFLPAGQSGNWGREMETRRPGRSRGDTNSSLLSPIPAKSLTPFPALLGCTFRSTSLPINHQPNF